MSKTDGGVRLLYDKEHYFIICFMISNFDSAPSEPLPKHLELPWLGVVHDGTQSEIGAAELEAVAFKFNSLVGNLQLNFAEDVRHLGSRDRLELKLPIDDKDYWSIDVSATEAVKNIGLQRLEGVYGREGVDYYMEADRIVRRKTFGDLAMKIAEAGEDPTNLAPRNNISPEEALPLVRNLGRLLANTIENQRLEKAMGYNYQPITLDEVDSLTDFLSQPGMQATHY